MGLFTVAEGICIGQVVFCCKKAQLNISNILPTGTMPKGTYYLEDKPADRSKLASASGNCASHLPQPRDQQDPSEAAFRSKVIFFSQQSCCWCGGVGAQMTNLSYILPYILVHARSTRQKELLAMCMGYGHETWEGGNHQHTGKPSTIQRDAPSACKVGLTAAHQTG